MSINAFEVGFGAVYVHHEDAFIYTADKRPRRDIVWTVAYGLLAALTLAGSIPVFLTHQSTEFYSNRFFNNSTSCDIQKYQQVAWMYNDAHLDPTFMRRFRVGAAIWLPATAALALLGSALYLLLFTRFPRTLLGVAALGSMMAGAGVSAACFATGALPAGIILVGCTTLTTGFFVWIGRWARMVSELMVAAAHSLRRNQRLLPAALGIMIAGLLVLSYGFAAFFSAVNYGYVSRNWDAVQRKSVEEENGFCLNAALQRIPCCIFVTHAWAYAYAAAAAVFVVWSASLGLQLKTFTAADTMAQSYFLTAAFPSRSSRADVSLHADLGFAGIGPPPGVALAAASTPTPTTLASSSNSSSSVLRAALRHCLAASFGSLAAAAAVLAPLRAVRWSCQALVRLRGVGGAAGCVLRPLTSASDRFSRFAAISAAMTGRPFLPAAKAVCGLLQRNHLPRYDLWWVPDKLLLVCSTLLSLAWSGVVFFATYSTNREFRPVALSVSFATAGACCLLMLYCLLFTTGLQLDAVHTLYICYAMDKDQRRVTQPEVHAAIRQVPPLFQMQGQPAQQDWSNPVYGTPEQYGTTEMWQMPPPVAAPAAAAAAVAATAAPARATVDTALPPPLPPYPGLDGTEVAPPRIGLPGANPSRLKRRAL